MLRVKPNGANTKPEDVKSVCDVVHATSRKRHMSLELIQISLPSLNRSILIDCGKSFLTSALEWFPKKGFRKIDALVSVVLPIQGSPQADHVEPIQVITHAHRYGQAIVCLQMLGCMMLTPL